MVDILNPKTEEIPQIESQIIQEEKIPVMDIHSSTEKEYRFTVSNMFQFVSLATQRIVNMTKLINAKITGDKTWVFAVPTEVFRIMATAMKPFFDIKIIRREEWDNPPELNRKKTLIFSCWNEDSPLEKWIEKGYVTKDDFFLGIIKDEEKKKNISEQVKLIDFWANSELDGGLKFPECDRYHRVSTGVVLDDKVIFETGTDNCRCGFKGQTFIPNETKLRS